MNEFYRDSSNQKHMLALVRFTLLLINSEDLVKVGLFVLGKSLCNYRFVHSNATLLYTSALKSESLRIIIMFRWLMVCVLL